MARGSKGSSTLAGKERMTAGIRVTGQSGAEDISNGRQPVVGLVSGNVVDVRGARQVCRLVCDMAGQWVGVVAAGKCLA